MLKRVKLEKSDRYILKAFLLCKQPKTFFGDDFELWVDGIAGYITRLLKGERLSLNEILHYEPDQDMMKVLDRLH